MSDVESAIFLLLISAKGFSNLHSFCELTRHLLRLKVRYNIIFLADFNIGLPFHVFYSCTCAPSLRLNLQYYLFLSDWLSIWCVDFFVDFGHVRIPKDLNVPPSLRMLGVEPQSKLNCEVLAFYQITFKFL